MIRWQEVSIRAEHDFIYFGSEDNLPDLTCQYTSDKIT